VLQKSETETRLRIAGALRFADGKAKAQCHWCGGELELPIALLAPDPVPVERYTVRLTRERTTE